jgi:hypothetical protein
MMNVAVDEGELNNDDGESIRCLMFPEDDVLTLVINRRSAFFGAQIGAQNATFQRCSPKGSNGLTASISTLKLS